MRVRVGLLAVIGVVLGCGSDGGGGDTHADAMASDAGRVLPDAGPGESDANVPLDGGEIDAGLDGSPSESDAGEAGVIDAAPEDAEVEDAGDAAPAPEDEDADDDRISDDDEGRDDDRDSDGDGTADYLDTDADDDCRSDAIEAGDEDADTAPVDTDLDGQPDYRDRDSDDDLVIDEEEDQDCDGARAGAETSAVLADSDADDATDLIERSLGTDPNDAGDNPDANGDLVFLAPYQAAPSPAQGGAELSTALAALDVFFLMDTTGSMGGELTNLQNSFSTNLVALADLGVDVAAGVGGYDDFADAGACYGSAASGDLPFYLRHRIMTASTATGISSLQTAVNALALHGGVDTPESGWQALYQLAHGTSLTFGATTVPAFDPATAPPMPVPAGERTGTLGGAGFRAGALHVIVMITDASSHNSTAYAGDPAYGGTENLYGYGSCAPIASAATKTQAIDSLAAQLSARVVGIVSAGGSADAKPDLATAVRATRAEVPPAAWDADGPRPAGCSAAQCCTGQNGMGVSPDASGNCPLLYDVASTGAGLGVSLLDGIAGLARFGRANIDAEVIDQDTGDAVHPADAFVDRLEASAAAAGPCAAHVTMDTNADGTPDRFVDLQFGATACFGVHALTNTTVPALGTAQVFEAALEARGSDGLEVLGSRRIYFIVPPDIETP